MELEKRKNFIINLLYWAAMLLIAYLVFKYLLGLIMPFIWAFLFSSLLRPVSRFLVNKLHFPQKPASLLVTLLFFGVIVTLFILIGLRLVSAIVDLFGMLPWIYQTTIVPSLTNFMNALEEFFDTLNIPLLETINELGPTIIDSLGNIVSRVSGAVGTWATSLVVRTPRFLASLIVMIIATFFMSLDYDKMTSFVLRQLPKRAEKLLKDIKHSFVLVLLRYGRSYAIIFVITSVELSLGLLFLGINNAPVIALIIAVFDIFPILGTGTILGPWAAIELFRGEYHQALGLIILYVIVTVIRQVMEPRIVGSHVGLHPLITIMSIFIGGSLFGVVGFFGLPITVALLRSLMDGGTIKIFNRRGAEDSDGDDAAADSDSESQDTPPE